MRPNAPAPYALAVVLAALLSSCEQPTPPSTESVEDEPGQERGAILLRERLDDLHSLSIGPLERRHRRKQQPPDQITLSAEWTPTQTAETADVMVWQARAPIRANTSLWQARRTGIEISRSDVVLESVDADSLRQGPNRWWLDEHGTLFVSSPATATPPSLDPLEIEAFPQAYQQSRMEFIGRDPDPRDVLVDAVTVGGDRELEGLFMPAPSSATWVLELPDWPAALRLQPFLMAPAMQYLPDPDGATFVVSVSPIRGRSQEIFRETLGVGETGKITTIDLGPWVGQRIQLTLETLAGRNNHHDHAGWLHAAVVRADEEPRRVLVLVLDTLRADRVSSYGYPLPTTPYLDELASRGARFTNAYAPAPWTLPSHRTLLSGRPPDRFDEGTTLAEDLRRAGFMTVGWSANAFLGASFGCDRGFSEWNWCSKPPADIQSDRALWWLQQHPDDSALVFVNYMDCHDPLERYDEYIESLRGPSEGTTPSETNETSILYDGALRFLDEHVDRLIREATGLPGRTWIVVVSDHGEEFGDHGGFGHGHTLYNELVRVPVIMVGPDIDPGQVVSAMVALQDVAPTIRGLLGVSPAPAGYGVDLGPSLRAKGHSSVPSSRVFDLGHTNNYADLLGFVDQDHKYIQGGGRRELYDIRSDPLEQVDLAQQTGTTEFRRRVEERSNRLGAPTIRVVVRCPKTKIGDAPSELKLTFAAPVGRVLYGPSIHGMRAVPHESNSFVIARDKANDLTFVVMDTEILVQASAPLQETLAHVSISADGGEGVELRPRTDPLHQVARDGDFVTVATEQVGPLGITLEAGYYPWPTGTNAGAGSQDVPELDQATLETLRALGYVE